MHELLSLTQHNTVHGLISNYKKIEHSMSKNDDHDVGQWKRVCKSKQGYDTGVSPTQHSQLSRRHRPHHHHDQHPNQNNQY